MRRKNCVCAIAAAASIGLAGAAHQARADVIYQDNFDGTAEFCRIAQDEGLGSRAY